MVQGQF